MFMCLSAHWLDLRRSGNELLSNLQVPGILRIYVVFFHLIKSEGLG